MIHIDPSLLATCFFQTPVGVGLLYPLQLDKLLLFWRLNRMISLHSFASESKLIHVVDTFLPNFN